MSNPTTLQINRTSAYLAMQDNARGRREGFHHQLANLISTQGDRVGEAWFACYGPGNARAVQCLLPRTQCFPDACVFPMRSITACVSLMRNQSRSRRSTFVMAFSDTVCCFVGAIGIALYKYLASCTRIELEGSCIHSPLVSNLPNIQASFSCLQAPQVSTAPSQCSPPNLAPKT